MPASHDNFHVTTLIDRASGESGRVKNIVASISTRLGFTGTGAINSTVIGLAKIYAYTDTQGITLTISDDLIALGSPTVPFIFIVKDEGGNAATNNIIVSGGTALINGDGTVNIGLDSGSITFYSDGTDLFTID